MSTSTDYVEQSVNMVERLDGFELAPHAIRLLSEGEPVALDRIAAAAERPVEDVEAALRGARGPQWDEQGRLVGFGLTLRPTQHRVTIEGRTLFGWCASDTLMFPVILGRPVSVESTCPHTGQAIRVEVTPEGIERVEPQDAVVSTVRPAGEVEDVRLAVCDHGHYYSSAAAASSWIDEHPEGHIHPVLDAFRLDRQTLEKLGWSAPDAG